MDHYPSSGCYGQPVQLAPSGPRTLPQMAAQHVPFGTKTSFSGAYNTYDAYNKGGYGQHHPQLSKKGSHSIRDLLGMPFFYNYYRRAEFFIISKGWCLGQGK